MADDPRCLHCGHTQMEHDHLALCDVPGCRCVSYQGEDELIDPELNFDNDEEAA